MNPSSQGSRSARSSEWAAAGIELGPAAGPGFAAAASAKPNRQRNREVESKAGCGRDIVIPLKLRWLKRMFTLREIFYNEKLRALGTGPDRAYRARDGWRTLGPH